MVLHVCMNQENSQWGSSSYSLSVLLSVTHAWLSALEHGQEPCAVFSIMREGL